MTAGDLTTLRTKVYAGVRQFLTSTKESDAGAAWYIGMMLERAKVEDKPAWAEMQRGLKTMESSVGTWLAASAAFLKAGSSDQVTGNRLMTTGTQLYDGMRNMRDAAKRNATSDFVNYFKGTLKIMKDVAVEFAAMTAQGLQQVGAIGQFLMRNLGVVLVVAAVAYFFGPKLIAMVMKKGGKE